MRLRNLGKILIGTAMAAAVALSASAEFAKTATYADGQFADVKSDAWYAGEVKNAYELGFMNGTSATAFSPDGNVSVAQGITMAARVNAIFNGKTVPENSTSGNWYDNAVKYALENGIIKEGQFDSYTREIKRWEMAVLFFDALPSDYYTAVNDVDAIPDVSGSASYAEKLLALYNAGIVMGSDNYGTFYPENNIKRSESAAIINRVAIPENRLKKTLAKVSADDAYTLCYNTTYDSSKEGVNSGWVLDNRGGQIRTSLMGGYGPINDISEEYGTAMIREFNQINSGCIVAETVLTVSGNGVYVEFRDKDDKSVYQIKLIDGSWQVLGKDGNYSVIMKDALDEDGTDAQFKLRLCVDLNESSATTYINDVNCGTSALLSDNILNFRYATDEKSTATASPGTMNIVANYAVYDDFTYFGTDSVYGWTTSGSVTSRSELGLEGEASAKKTFKPLTGKVCAETYFILPEGGDADVILASGDKAAVNISSVNGKLCVNGKELYSLTKNMWYRLRIEADITTGTADVLLNGRSIGQTQLLANSAIDSIKFATKGANARFDYVKVYNLYEHSDYVPEPTTKASFDDYVVGLNVCSLWRNGTHWGWACITPYDEPRPVLGYYDEGVPETADWEIKYMVEHGIDFQAFCWFADASTTPIKEPRNGSQLHDGYMYAKYSDYMKYCLIWEASSGQAFNAEQFRTNVIPYWFENYFLDDRYLKLDNKLVLCIFGAAQLTDSKYFGSTEKAKAEFDYLDEVAKSYGFDGVIVVSSNDYNPDLAKIGVDAAYAYNWGTDGNKLESNKIGILTSAKNGALYTIPTISVGFDSIPWNGVRYGNMTVEDFAKAQEWVKTEYLPQYSTAGSWNDKLVMISTWNEYGEGTYIMPAGLNGFGYLEALRDAYTNLPEEHEDLVPTASQAERINHLYPQYARLLRREGWCKQEINADAFESVFLYEFNEDTSSPVNIDSSSIKYDENGITGVAKLGSNDPYVQVNRDLNVVIDNVTHINVTLKAPKGKTVEIFFLTVADGTWTQDKSIQFTTDSSDLKTYTVEINNSAWNGALKRLRVDPVRAGDTEFTVKSFELLQKKDVLTRELYINDMLIENVLPAVDTDNDVLFPFDPATAVNFILNSFYTWRKDDGTLKIEANHHVVEYTVGSDKYKVDGTEKNLGYELYCVDGVPMLSFKTLSAALGYEYTEKDGGCYVKTTQYDIYNVINNRVPGSWEFNDYDTEGWSSAHMTLLVTDGTMTLTTISDTNYDPIMTLSKPVDLVADKYKTMEVRCRYKYDNRKHGLDSLCIYFITDQDRTWNEEKNIKVNLETTDTGNEWVTYTIDLKEYESWSDTVTNLRLDPFNAIGYMEIDYLRFVEDPDYVYVDPDTIPFGIENGDAENTAKVAFTSINGKVSITEDPDNADNHVYLVTANDGKQWTYFIQGARFKEGKTYKVSYDVRSLGDNSGDETAGAQIMCNFKYPESTALNGIDHIVNTAKSPVGQWTHVEFEYTVEKVDSNNGHQFTLYANPNGDYGMNYMVDNVVVVES